MGGLSTTAWHTTPTGWCLAASGDGVADLAEAFEPAVSPQRCMRTLDHRGLPTSPARREPLNRLSFSRFSSLASCLALALGSIT